MAYEPALLMIDPVATEPHSTVTAYRFRSNPTSAGATNERSPESLAAPNGTEAEIHFHRGLISAAEREFGRLLVRIESLLQTVI